LGAEKKGLILWMSIGIVIWSIALTVAGSMGLLALETMVK